MFSLRTHALISAALFAGIFAAPLLLSGLQSAGVLKGANLETPIKVSVFALFIAFGFSLMPVMLKLFLAGQGAIGNAGLGTIRFLSAHQTGVVIGFWAFLSLGLVIAIPAALEDGFFANGAKRSVAAFFRGPSQGVLLAVPGMTVDELFRGSTLKINDGGVKRRDLPVYAAGGVFDFQIAGTPTTFRNCQYYYISTYTRDASRIEGINVGISPEKVTRAELEQANVALRAQLAAEGWLAGHEVYRTEEDQQLHGGATRGEAGLMWLKNDIILDIESRRMDDPVAGEDATTAGEWIQFIDLRAKAEYPNIERYEFAPYEG